MTSKSDLREDLRKKRREFNRSLGAAHSTHFIQTQLSLVKNLALLLQEKRGVWGSYQPFDGEADPNGVTPLTSHIKWSYPLIENSAMHFFIPQGELIINRWGILEPNPMTSQKTLKNDLKGILIPGVAFDLFGTRLGLGLGFYDKFLANWRGVKIGVAFSIQVMTEPLPKENHDVTMDWVVTEKNIFNMERPVQAS